MQSNVGAVDRVIRLVLGLGLIAWGMGFIPAFGEIPSWGWIAAIVGVVFAVTALLGSCPMYQLFGISTCRSRS